MSMDELRNKSATEAAAHPSHPGATETIVPRNPTALSLAGRSKIDNEGTLRIEDVRSHVVRYLYFVILRNGEIKGVLFE